MVEIIETGELPELKQYVTRCSHCKTKFRFAAGDTRLSSDPRDGALMVIKCPLRGCEKDCYVNP